MIYCVLWTMWSLGQQFWISYVDRCFSSTQTWMWGCLDGPVMRRPDILVSSFTTENHVSIDLNRF